MNNLKKIFLFLGVLMIVLMPGFNKLQAAETVTITAIDPNSQATGSQFQPLTVEFTTNFEVPSGAPVSNIDLSWSCDNLNIENFLVMSQNIYYNIYTEAGVKITGDGADDITSPPFVGVNPEEVTWSINPLKSLPDGSYKIQIAELGGESYLKTGSDSEICEIKLMVGGTVYHSAIAEFIVGSPVTIDPTLILDPATTVIDQAIGPLKIDFIVMANKRLDQSSKLKLDLGSFVNKGLTVSDLSIVNKVTTGPLDVSVVTLNFPFIEWNVNQLISAVANPVSYTIKIGSDAAKKIQAPAAVGPFDITFAYNNEMPPGKAPFTVTPAGLPTVGFASATYNLNENSGDTTIPVNLLPANTKIVTVAYTVTPTGATAPADYTLVPAGPSSTLTFPVGSAVQNFTITIIDDAVDDDNEKVEITLNDAKDSDGNSITISQAKTTINIIDNDGAPPGPTGTQAGDSCDPGIESSCGVDTGLECEEKTPGSTTGYCVPEPENRNIGTWCMEYKHCKTESGDLDLTCDEDKDRCVGATANVPCMNDDINNNSVWGDTYDQMDSSDRCAVGLFCDPDNGSCQNDFGQGKIPFDKLGEAADDIRDQIRNVINIALGFLGVAGVILVIYGGAIWMSAAGDDEKVGKAKKTIIAGMIGLVIIGVAWTIVSYVLSITQDIS